MKREGRRGVPKPLLYDLRVYALLEEQRGVTMSQIMEPDTRDLCALHGFLEIAPDDVMGVQRFTIRLAEYEAQALVGVPVQRGSTSRRRVRRAHPSRRRTTRSSRT